MSSKDEKLLMMNADGTPSKTHLALFKYEPYKRAILSALQDAGDEGVYFKDLPEQVRVRLPEKDLTKLGSIMWHVTTVKLDLEGRGQIERIAKVKPQKVRLI